MSYQIISRSGDENAFASMVSKCKSQGVDVYVDVVMNHMAQGSGVGIAGTNYGGRSYLNYSADDMHHNDGDDSSNCVVNNYQDQHNVQYCDLEALPDLCTECPNVQNVLRSYLSKLKDLGVSGFRVDAAKHQNPPDLANVLQPFSDMTVLQEVIEGAGEAVKAEMYYNSGLVTEFRYGYCVGDVFLQNNNLDSLRTMNVTCDWMPTSNALTFLNNHDTQRGQAPLTYKDGSVFDLANVFMLAWPYGYTRLMSSYYFDNFDQGPPTSPVYNTDGSTTCGDGKTWVCEHRNVANMVRFRSVAASEDVTNWNLITNSQVSFSRGSKAFLILNNDRNNAIQNMDFKNTGLPEGTYCNVIVSDDVQNCPTVSVDSNGDIYGVSVSPISALAIHAGSKK